MLPYRGFTAIGRDVPRTREELYLLFTYMSYVHLNATDES